VTAGRVHPGAEQFGRKGVNAQREVSLERSGVPTETWRIGIHA
jgi:hypothetical protein